MEYPSYVTVPKGKELIFTVSVTDQNNNPVSGAGITIIDHTNDRETHESTDKSGQTTYSMFPVVSGIVDYNAAVNFDNIWYCHTPVFY